MQQLPHLELHVQFMLAPRTLGLAAAKFPGERPVRFIERDVEREVNAERMVESTDRLR